MSRSLRGTLKRWGLALACALALPVTGCLDRVNPVDPDASVQLELTGPDTLHADSTASYTATWTPVGGRADWHYDPMGVVVFSSIADEATTGTSRATVLAFQPGQVTLTAAVGAHRITKSIVVVTP